MRRRRGGRVDHRRRTGAHQRARQQEPPDVEVPIVPDNCRCAGRRAPIRDFFARLGGGNKLRRKYRTANRVLDVSLQLERVVFDCAPADAPRSVAATLARAFGRSCVIADGRTTIAPFAGEDTAFFASPHELAIADWCRKNELPAGKGTDTLRDAAAIYFPVRTRHEVVAVGFLCARSKMTVTDKLVFRQLESLLKLILCSSCQPRPSVIYLNKNGR